MKKDRERTRDFVLYDEDRKKTFDDLSHIKEEELPVSAEIENFPKPKKPVREKAYSSIIKGHVILMRIQGYTLSEIAKYLKQPFSKVSSICRKEMDEIQRRRNHTAIRIDQWMEHDWDLTDDLLIVWGERALAGDPEAARIVISVLERRAKYRGLDRPEALRHMGEIPKSREEFTIMVRERIREVRMKFESPNLDNPGSDSLDVETFHIDEGENENGSAKHAIDGGDEGVFGST